MKKLVDLFNKNPERSANLVTSVFFSVGFFRGVNTLIEKNNEKKVIENSCTVSI